MVKRWLGLLLITNTRYQMTKRFNHATATQLTAALTLLSLSACGIINSGTLSESVQPEQLTQDDRVFFAETKKLQRLLDQSAQIVLDTGVQSWHVKPPSKGTIAVVAGMTQYPERDLWFFNGIWRPDRFRSDKALMLTGLQTVQDINKLRQPTIEEFNPTGKTIIMAAPASNRGVPYVWGNVVYFSNNGRAYSFSGSAGAYHVFQNRVCAFTSDAYGRTKPVCLRPFVDNIGQAYIETDHLQGHVSKVVAVIQGDELGLESINAHVQSTARGGGSGRQEGLGMTVQSLKDFVNRGKK